MFLHISNLVFNQIQFLVQFLVVLTLFLSKLLKIKRRSAVVLDKLFAFPLMHFIILSPISVLHLLRRVIASRSRIVIACVSSVLIVIRRIMFPISGIDRLFVPLMPCFDNITLSLVRPLLSVLGESLF